MMQVHNSARMIAASGLNVGTTDSTTKCLTASSGQDQHVSEFSWDWLFRHQGNKLYTVKCVIMPRRLQKAIDKL
jgi:hypothetical protein